MYKKADSSCEWWHSFPLYTQRFLERPRGLPFPTFFAWTKMATIRWNPQGRAHTAGGWAAASPLEPTYLFLFCKSLDLLLKRSVSCSTLTPPAPLSLLSQRRRGRKKRTHRQKEQLFFPLSAQLASSARGERGCPKDRGEVPNTPTVRHHRSAFRITK